MKDNIIIEVTNGKATIFIDQIAGVADHEIKLAEKDMKSEVLLSGGYMLYSTESRNDILHKIHEAEK